MHIRIATYNIHQCVGRDGIQHPKRIATVLNELNADIIALQEVTSHPKMSDDPLANLAEATEMQPFEGFTLSSADARYGNAFLSKLPVAAVNRIEISVKKREPRGVIEMTLNHNRQRVTLWATHLGLGIHERQQQINSLMEVIDSADADVSILLGDFNEWFPWGRPLRALNRWFTKVQSPATFPSRSPFLKLDRIWVRPVNKLTTLRVHSTKLSRVASDHLPLVADVAL